MLTTIENWLGYRLGILIDTSPENFGKHAKDGRLLAKLLYSYGVIPVQVYNTIKSSKNVNDCYKNLMALKPWLEYLEVPIKNEVLYDIASCDGLASVNLFYVLYLHLEKKDKLHYMSAQKQRLYATECTKRDIKIEWVPEKDVMFREMECDSNLAQPLIKKKNIVQWHREKCNEILKKVQCIKENYALTQRAKKSELELLTLKKTTSRKPPGKISEIENTQNDIEVFSEQHNTCLPDLNYYELINLQNEVNAMTPKSVPNFKEAENYINLIKQRSKTGAVIQKFQEGMQLLAIENLWDKINKKQDDNFEEIVCKNLLKQSQYEKQMCTKLALMRRQKEVVLRNRMIVDSLKNACRKKEYDDSLNDKMELAAEEALEEEFENKKILELHKRRYIEKVKRRFEERLEEARSILDKIIDIAIRISEFRESYACEVPKHLMKDIKELFFKNLPIFDILEDMEDIYRVPVCPQRDEKEEKEEFGEEHDLELGDKDYEDLECISEEARDNSVREESEEFDFAKAAECIRQEVLNECDFNDYMFLLGPWLVELLFPDEPGTEVSQLVLGYIVHKMLECKYPSITLPTPPEIKPMYPRAIVQGSSDESAFNMLSELMALRKVLVVRIDDAIKFVLNAYKEELSVVRDIDITFQQATRIALKGKGGTERTKEPSKKEQLLKKESISLKGEASVEETDFKDESTQTPRRIPEDDPLLSPNAEIGKSAFEALGIGDPVPDDTAISAVIAYVISLQENYVGWVLWNYPILYSQASKLECALTGLQLMSIDDEMDTLEGLEGFGCRTNCQNAAGNDEFANKRISRLVPKPEPDKSPAKAESYFSAFIRLRKKGNELTAKSGTMLSGQGQEYLDKFYSEQQILYLFEYSSISFQIIKDIGKIVLGEINEPGESSAELVGKTSLEIFGNDVTELNDMYNPPKKKPDKESKKPTETPKKVKAPVEVVELPINGSCSEKFEEEMLQVERDVKTKKSFDIAPGIARPGDSDWEWATGNQPENLQLALASFWENLETVFIEDIKYVFFCLRVHRNKTIRYQSYLKQTLETFMRKEDDKQVILSDFQQKFNDIDDDLRPDSDVKCELHVRVSELEEALLQFADERRENSENNRVKFISDNWVSDELTNLVNLYISALQLEANRCIDTCQFINDYYLSLQQRLPHDNVLRKIYAPKLENREKSYSITSALSKNPTNQPVPSTNNLRSSKSSIRRKLKNEKESFSAVVPTRAECSVTRDDFIFIPEASEAIADILRNLEFPSNGTTPFHSYFLNILQELKNSVKDVVESCLTEVKKGSGVGGTGATGKDKKKTAEVKTETNGKLTTEWTVALESELSRFLYRMRLIEMRGIVEFNEFILVILTTLENISEAMDEMYNREIKSISECCKVFRCAIEEEIAIQPRLELNVDEFVINENVLLFPDFSCDVLSSKEMPDVSHIFTIEQLSFICKKIQYLAPDGEILRRSFLYILEDLRVLKSEDGVPRLFPKIWDDIEPNDLPHVFDQIYQRIEMVNWKDFIIYAMELPMATEGDILTMRLIFRSFDESNTELISYEDYSNVTFWFENESLLDRKRIFEAKELLFRLFQVDENYTNYTALLLAFCKDTDVNLGFTKALALCLGKRILIEESEKEFGSAEGEQEYLEGNDFGIPTLGREAYIRDKNRRYPCQCKDPSDYQTISETEIEAGEAYDFYFDYGENIKASSTSDIPRDVIKKVILASYPAFPQLTVLLGCRNTFEQTMTIVFENLSTDGVTVKSHKLLKHKFISRLLRNTNKFKIVDLKNIITALLEKTQSNDSSTSSFSGPENCPLNKFS